MPEEKPRKLWMKNGKLLVNSDGQPLLSDHCCCDDSSTSAYCYQKWVTGCDDSSEWLEPVMVDHVCGEQDPELEEQAGAWMLDESGNTYQWVANSFYGKHASRFCSDCETTGDIPEVPGWPCSCERLWATGYMTEQMVELPYVIVHVAPLIIETWRPATEEDDSSSIVRGMGPDYGASSYVRVSSTVIPHWGAYMAPLPPTGGLRTVKFVSDTPGYVTFSYYIDNYRTGPFNTAIGAGHPSESQRAAYSSAYDSAARASKAFLYCKSTSVVSAGQVFFPVDEQNSIYAPFAAVEYPVALDDREYFPGIIMPDDISYEAPQMINISGGESIGFQYMFDRQRHLAGAVLISECIEACDENGTGKEFFAGRLDFPGVSSKSLVYYSALAGRWEDEFGSMHWGSISVEKQCPVSSSVGIHWVLERRGGTIIKNSIGTSDTQSDRDGSHLEGAPVWHWRSYLYTDIDLSGLNSKLQQAALHGTEEEDTGRWNVQYFGVKCVDYRFLCHLQARYTCDSNLRPAPAIPPALMSAGSVVEIGEVTEVAGQVGVEAVVALNTPNPSPWFDPEFIDSNYPGQDRTIWLRGNPEYDAKSLDDVIPADDSATGGSWRSYAFMLQRLSVHNFPSARGEERLASARLTDCAPRQVFTCEFYSAYIDRLYCYPARNVGYDGKLVCVESRPLDSERYYTGFTLGLDPVGKAPLIVEGSTLASNVYSCSNYSSGVCRVYDSTLFNHSFGYGDWTLKWYRITRYTLSRKIDSKASSTGKDSATDAQGHCTYYYSSKSWYEPLDSAYSSITVESSFSVDEQWTKSVKLNWCGRVDSGDYVQPPGTSIGQNSVPFSYGQSRIGYFSWASETVYVAYLVPDSFCKDPGSGWFPKNSGSVGGWNSPPFWSSHYSGWAYSSNCGSGSSSGGGGTSCFAYSHGSGNACSLCYDTGNVRVVSSNTCAPGLAGTWYVGWCYGDTVAPWETDPVLVQGSNRVLTGYGIYSLNGSPHQVSSAWIDVHSAAGISAGSSAYVGVGNSSTCTAVVKHPA